jgi:hypothetical protein
MMRELGVLVGIALVVALLLRAVAGVAPGPPPILDVPVWRGGQAR